MLELIRPQPSILGPGQLEENVVPRKRRMAALLEGKFYGGKQFCLGAYEIYPGPCRGFGGSFLMVS